MSASELPLRGRLALVTGAASGIGASCAIQMAAAGARVLVADMNESAGRAVAASINGEFLYLDVSDEKSWVNALSGISRLDIVILNAGIMTRPRGARSLDRPLQLITAANYQKVFNVNVAGVLLGIIATRPLLEAAGGGDIIVTSSIAGVTSVPGDPIYSASKHAVLGLVRGLAPLMIRLKIRLNAICPGVIETGLVSSDLQRESGHVVSPPEYVAEAFMQALKEGGSGRVWMAIGQGRPFYEYHWPSL